MLVSDESRKTVSDPDPADDEQASGLRTSFIIITVVSLCFAVALVLNNTCPHTYEKTISTIEEFVKRNLTDIEYYRVPKQLTANHL